MSNGPRSNDDELRQRFEQLMAHDQQSAASRPEPAAAPAARDESMLRRGRISGLAGRDVFVELGEREQGVISVQEFAEPPAIGQEFDFKLLDFQDELWTLSRAEARRMESYQSLSRGAWTKCTVKGHNSGGFEVEVGPLRGFLPFSQMDRAADNPDERIGENFVVEVMDVDPAADRLVVSRRKVLDEERRKKREASLQTLVAGAMLRGTVEKIEPFGVFLRINEGVTGLLHISEWSHERVESLDGLVSEGQEVEVKVLEISDNGRRISLSRKALLQHPWDGVQRRLAVGQVVTGRVTRIAEYGAFLELETGVEGLLHVSQLSSDRVRRVSDHANKGDRLEVRIVAIDEAERRISLSRLTASGALLGSDEDVSYEDVDQSLRPETSARGARVQGTNLGDLLRAALEQGPGASGDHAKSSRESKKKKKKKKR